ncbi:MAG: helix-turn-helix transcriptional regulator [Bacteroidota bacterium]
MEKYIFTGILIATLLSMVDHRAPLPKRVQPLTESAQAKASSLGKQIQLARIRKGYSQRYLARMSGISIETISSIEREDTIPTINNLYKIQEILGGGIVVNGDAMARS